MGREVAEFPRHHAAGSLPGVWLTAAARLNWSLFPRRSENRGLCPSGGVSGHGLATPLHVGRVLARGSSRKEESESRLIASSQSWRAATAPWSHPPGERKLTRPPRGGSTRDAQHSSAATMLWIGESVPKRLRRPCPSRSPRARSRAATGATDRGPSSLDSPGCPFIRPPICFLCWPRTRI